MIKEIVAKIAIGIISTLSVASVGVITVASVPALENAIVETFASDEEQFRKVLVENAASDAQDFLEVISTKKATDTLIKAKQLVNENTPVVDGPFDKRFYVDLDVSDSARLIGNMIQSKIDIPKSLSVDGKLRYDGDVATTDLGLSVNGVEIIRPEFIYNFGNDVIYFGVPVVYDRYICTNTDIIRSILSDEDIMGIVWYSLGIDPYEKGYWKVGDESTDGEIIQNYTVDLSIFDYLQGTYDRSETFATVSAIANLLYVYQQNVINNTWFETEVKNSVGTLYLTSPHTSLTKNSVFVEIGENVQEQTCYEITYSSEEMKVLAENAFEIFVSLIEKNADNTRLSEFLRGQWRKNLVKIMAEIDLYDSYTIDYYVNSGSERIGIKVNMNSEKPLTVSCLGIEKYADDVRMIEVIEDDISLFNLTYQKKTKTGEYDYSYALKLYIGDALSSNFEGSLFGMMVDKDSLSNIKITGDVVLKSDYPAENLSSFDLSATLEMLGMKAITLKTGLRDEVPTAITLPTRQETVELLEAVFALYLGLDLSELESRINEAGYSMGDFNIGIR